MSQFSSFAPFGQFEFSSEPKFLGERMYDAQIASLGPAFTGPNDEAETYADAMCYSVASEQITSAGAQDDPSQASYLIDSLMRDYGAPVMSSATLEYKRAILAFYMAASSGSFETAVIAGLTSILGSLLINWRPMNEDAPVPQEVIPSATYPVYSPPVNSAIKVITINDRILPGVGVVSYTRVQDDGNQILVGEKILIEPGARGIEEVVVAYAVSPGTFTSVFVKTHDPDSRAITGPCCTWSSNARHSMVIVAPSVLTSAPLLNRVHEFMRKTMPVVSTWVVCKESSAGYVGPFKVGDTVGQTPIGFSSGSTAILTTVP
jgi:hypothetical protein